MDGYILEHQPDHSLYQYKVNHPYVSNDIPQMRSACRQPYFDRSGQTSFFLGRPQYARDPYMIRESQILSLVKQHRDNTDLNMGGMIGGAFRNWVNETNAWLRSNYGFSAEKLSRFLQSPVFKELNFDASPDGTDHYTGLTLENTNLTCTCHSFISKPDIARRAIVSDVLGEDPNIPIE